MSVSLQGRPAVRRVAPTGLSLRSRLEIVLIIGAIIILALANGELAAVRAQARTERTLATESGATIDRISGEIQALILEIISDRTLQP